MFQFRKITLFFILSLSPALALAGSGYSPALMGDGQAREALEFEARGLADFILDVDEPVRAVIVELHGTPGFAAAGDKRGQAAANLAAQNAFMDTAARSGLRLLPRGAWREQTDGVPVLVHYRFTWLMNGFVAYVPESQLEALRARPEVADVHEPEDVRLFLDLSVDHILGAQPVIADRRLAVYGATEELDPAGEPGHPEAPAPTPADGYEGQGMILSAIDAGLDYFHPGFAGTGLTTPSPQLPPNAPSEDDNRKVIYFYNLGGAATRDDHGHGTHVAHTAAGYRVDGDTAPVIGYGANAGPTPGVERLHGVAPQARLLGYPVCGAAGNCPGDIELAIEDSASPFILTGTGDGGAIPTSVPKPVADVINMSLGGGTNPASASARVANNAVLAGLTVVAAAGNDGPGAATVGAPCVGALVMCVASNLDPGSTAGTDVLASMSAADPCAGESGCVLPPPPADTGQASTDNPAEPGERQGMKTFYMSGGGAIPDRSVSAHYVYVDRDQTDVPAQVAGRIALLTGGTGTFFQIVNPVAALEPEAILLITDTQSATAVAVVNGVPTFTFPVDDGGYLLDLMGGNNGHGDVSPLPLRVSAGVAVDAFEGEISGFSSRGPNAHANAGYRYLKPDISAPGSGILAATTPDGNVTAVGMANPEGYAVASGTSMASPHAAGAAVLVRQRLRALGFDTTDPDDPEYLGKRFEAAVLTRALLQNTATNLRTGLGEAEGDGPASSTSINDVGSGLTNIDAALTANAVLLAHTRLFSDEPREFTVPDGGVLPVDVDEHGSALMPLPTVSFGPVGVIGLIDTAVFEREIMLRTIHADGAGEYQLTATDNRNGSLDGVSLSFHDIDTDAEITSIQAGADETASFILRLTIDPQTAPLVSGMEMMWYLGATHAGSGQSLRMPVYALAAAPVLPFVAAPEMQETGGVEQPAEECDLDTDGQFTLNWSYQSPAPESPLPVGFRVERATFVDELFFDPADEELVAGANSTWSGSEQWTSQLNPETGNLAYFIPNLVEQNESLAMIEPVAIPGGSGASLSFVTNQSTEPGFDFAHVEISAGGGDWLQLGRFSGVFVGTRQFDLSPFSGQEVRVRFRMTSDLAVVDAGWYVEQIRLDADDWSLLDESGGETLFLDVETAESGPALYRVAGIFPQENGPQFLGAFSAPACVNVIGDTIFSDRFEGL